MENEHEANIARVIRAHSFFLAQTNNLFELNLSIKQEATTTTTTNVCILIFGMKKMAVLPLFHSLLNGTFYILCT